MSLELLEQTSRPGTADDDDLSHIACECNEAVGLCGADLRSAHLCPVDMSCGCDDCIVCLDLVDHHRRFCGA